MVISLDTETTGLDPIEDEILTLSMCDAETGEEVWDRMYRPSRATSWPEAEQINGISPSMVAGCPAISDDAEEIRDILGSAEALVIYNAAFDLGFLEEAGVLPEHLPGVEDAMLEFAEAYGEWDDRHGGHRWHRLEDAAAHVGYEWEGHAHSSLADARASAAVWRWLCERRLDAEDDGDMDPDWDGEWD